jgi:hypothetical protein
LKIFNKPGTKHLFYPKKEKTLNPNLMVPLKSFNMCVVCHNISFPPQGLHQFPSLDELQNINECIMCLA